MRHLEEATNETDRLVLDWRDYPAEDPARSLSAVLKKDPTNFMKRNHDEIHE